MTSYASKKKKAKRSRRELDLAPGCWSPKSSGIGLILPPELAFGKAMQISQRNTLNEAFFGNFLLYFTSTGEEKDLQNRMTWLHRLPALSTDGTNSALTLALRATASAYCGVETSNIALLQQACKLYGQALHMHSQLLRSKRDVTVHMVSTSVLLSLFEAMQATTADAYRAHINGAAKMIEVTGPGECLEGVLCQLFFHIRTQMTFVYLTTRSGDESNVCVRRILEGTLSYRKLPVFQKLTGSVSRLAECYVGLEEEEEGEGGKQMKIGLGSYVEMKSEVDALWLEYREMAEKKGEQLFWKSSAGTTEYRDAFTALCVAYFASARVLLSILAPRLAATYLDFIDYYGMILDAAAFLRTSTIGCAYMRMAAPLYLVALHGKTVGQRDIAVEIFEEWRLGSMGGISKLALERIYASKMLEQRTDDPPKGGMATVG